MEYLQSNLLEDSKIQENRRKIPLHLKETSQRKPDQKLTFWAEIVTELNGLLGEANDVPMV
jgi:hypothetical protein